MDGCSFNQMLFILRIDVERFSKLVAASRFRSRLTRNPEYRYPLDASFGDSVIDSD